MNDNIDAAELRNPILGETERDPDMINIKIGITKDLPIQYSRLTGTDFRTSSFNSSLTVRLSRLLSATSFALGGIKSSSSSESEMLIGFSEFPAMIEGTDEVAREEGGTVVLRLMSGLISSVSDIREGGLF